MLEKQERKKITYGHGEYDLIRNDGGVDSVESMRTVFLHTVSQRVPEVSDSLCSELLELYKKIPLFYYEADKKRLKKRKSKRHSYDWHRASWFNFNRPTWKVIEKAWINKSSSTPFKLEFEDYFAVFSERKDDWIFPMYDCPAHDDPNISLFIETMFHWSETYNLNETWCRLHAFETLDLWTQDSYCEEERIWQWLPRYQTLAENNKSLRPSLPDFDLTINFDLSEYLYEELLLYPTHGYRADFDEVFEKLQEKVNTLQENINEFLNIRDSKAEECGFAKSPKKRDYKDFELLVDFQVQKVPYKELGELYYKELESKEGKSTNVSDKSKIVRKHINELKDKLDLKLRPEGCRPGRPRKKP